VLEQHLSYNVSHIARAQQANSLDCHRVASSLCLGLLVLSECRGAFWTAPEKSARRQHGCRVNLRGDVHPGFDSMPIAGYAAGVCTAHALFAYWSQAEKTEEAHGTEACRLFVI
jgi:hypothetical protein